MWRHFLCGAEVSSDEVLSIGKFKPGAAIFYQNNQDNIRINDILYHNQNYTSFLLFRVPSYKISAEEYLNLSCLHRRLNSKWLTAFQRCCHTRRAPTARDNYLPPAP